MMYHSTRDKNNKASCSRAIARGLAEDGGLFVPEEFPSLTAGEISELCEMDYRRRSVRIMSKFLDGYTEDELSGFAQAAYGAKFDDAGIAPLHMLDEYTGVLELWHGPTCAFKDMALQMLPRLLTAALSKCGERREVCVLVATSGDTGKAALEGFADVPRTKVAVFYPRDGVSEIQKLQMITQRGNNVWVSAVAGNFDDAQAGVKRIFSDRTLAGRLSEKGWMLSSANSINVGRLLPQIVYYVSAYCDYTLSGRAAAGEELDFCVPTGNFGNILAGWYAKRMGLPVGRLICASNENNVLSEFIETGRYDRNRPFKTTISPSMDILVSSNLERLLFDLCGSDTLVSEYMSALAETGVYEINGDMKEKLRANFAAGWRGDGRTKEYLAKIWLEHGYLMDTHSAVAGSVLAALREKEKDCRHTVIVSTASPYKFAVDVLDAIGEPLTGDPVVALYDATGQKIPSPLKNLSGRSARFADCVTAAEMSGVVTEFLGL